MTQSTQERNEYIADFVKIQSNYIKGLLHELEQFVNTTIQFPEKEIEKQYFTHVAGENDHTYRIID